MRSSREVYKAQELLWSSDRVKGFFTDSKNNWDVIGFSLPIIGSSCFLKFSISTLWELPIYIKNNNNRIYRYDMILQVTITREYIDMIDYCKWQSSFSKILTFYV
jgi:hypothetical protein